MNYYFTLTVSTLPDKTKQRHKTADFEVIIVTVFYYLRARMIL